MARIRRARVPRAAPWRRLSERGGAATGWVDRAVPDRVCSHFTMVALRRTVDRAGVVGEEGASVTGDGVRIECHRGGVLSETGRGAGETGSARAAPRPPGTARARGARRQSLAARPGSVVESGCAVYTRNAKKQEARMLLHPALSEWARCACARGFTDETRVRSGGPARCAHTFFQTRDTRRYTSHTATPRPTTGPHAIYAISAAHRTGSPPAFEQRGSSPLHEHHSLSAVTGFYFYDKRTSTRLPSA